MTIKTTSLGIAKWQKLGLDFKCITKHLQLAALSFHKFFSNLNKKNILISNLFSDNKRNNLILPLALTNMALQESLIRHQNFKCTKQ